MKKRKGIRFLCVIFVDVLESTEKWPKCRLFGTFQNSPKLNILKNRSSSFDENQCFLGTLTRDDDISRDFNAEKINSHRGV